MKLAFLSPLPPDHTGVADYAAGLLEALRGHAQVDVVAAPHGGYDNYIYQVGNNPLHLPAYRGALARPGVTVLHDAVLHHLLLGILSEAEYVAEFVYNYGGWMRDLAGDLWRSRSRSASDARYFHYPMLRRVVESSRRVVVHNPRARRMVEQAVPGARVTEIPHYFVPPRLPGEASRTRQELGVEAHELLVAAFGYLRESKRLRSVLLALRGVPRTRFLLVGEFVSPELEESLGPLLEEARVIRRPHVPEAEFWRLAEAVDVCVNLRDPSAGETSGIGIRLMGIGKPVIVTASAENAGYPETAVLRVDAGEPEADMLACCLAALAGSPEMRETIGRHAAEHVASEHSLEGAARRYLELATEGCRLP